jgi:hypothetical protein
MTLHWLSEDDHPGNVHVVGPGLDQNFFELPSNAAANPRHQERFYRMDLGPVTLITLDSSDGMPEGTSADTNHSLTGSQAPDFNPGSEQYRWLEHQLADAQRRRRFTFVQFHHTPFGSGPHSVPFGQENFSGQSGIAMRVLVPLLMRCGVDAVFCGHNEMLELSRVEGREESPDTTSRPHAIHFYDAGIGGDGLRGPSPNFDNPYRVFLAHDNSREQWDGKRLVSGGKHYGHLEVNVAPEADGTWKATIEMVHAFPVTDHQGTVVGWERRLYPTQLRYRPLELLASGASFDVALFLMLSKNCYCKERGSLHRNRVLKPLREGTPPWLLSRKRLIRSRGF